MGSYKFIDHTADIGVEVEANSIVELFSETVNALINILTELPPEEIKARIGKRKGIKEKMIVKKDSWENVILDLLNRIIFLVDTKKLVPISLYIKEKKNTYRFLIEMINEPSLLKREIKAATYHNLKVNEEKNIYRVTIIFDI